jgi:hypothetical protein
LEAAKSSGKPRRDPERRRFTRTPRPSRASALPFMAVATPTLNSFATRGLIVAHPDSAVAVDSFFREGYMARQLQACQRDFKKKKGLAARPYPRSSVAHGMPRGGPGVTLERRLLCGGSVPQTRRRAHGWTRQALDSRYAERRAEWSSGGGMANASAHYLTLCHGGRRYLPFFGGSHVWVLSIRPAN